MRRALYQARLYSVCKSIREAKMLKETTIKGKFLGGIKRNALLGISFAALVPAAQAASPALATALPNATTTFPAPPPSNNTGTLQDVVITARHRAERAQSVPISLTVVDHRQIQALGSLNLNTIKQLVPTLTINVYNPHNLNPDIRGLGSNGFIGYDGLESGVATYIDGVLLGRSIASNFDIPEIEDIEVLRGPQGTLFGKNAVAGAINIRTRAPSFKPEQDFSASYGNYNYWQLQGYATSAIGNSDKAAVSLSVHTTQNDGYIKNTVNGARYDNTDDKGVRGQLLLEPTSNLTVRIIANYDHADANCCIIGPVNIVTNYANGAPVIPSIAGPGGRYTAAGYTLPTINPFARTTDIDSWTHYAMETGSLSAQADYNLDGFTLTSITAGGYTNWYPHLDADAVGIPIITTGNQTTYQRQFSQELRVTSPLGGAVDYTGGLFFFYQQLNDHAVTTYGQDAASVFLDTPPNSGATYQATQAALNGMGSADTDIPNTFSGAAYGQATWHITPKLDLTGGARFTYEDKTGNYYATQQGGISLAGDPLAQAIRNAYAPTLPYKLQHSNMLPGGLVTLSYKPQPNILTYALYSHGEKSAGLNFIASTSVPKIVAPEKIDDYEIGAKTTLLDGRLLLNGDAFWEEDTDFQSTIYGPVGPGGALLAYLSNVPKVRSRGLEFDTRAQVTDNLSVFSSGIFDEAYYESNPAAPCPYEDSNVSKVCNLTGRPLAGASKWTVSLGGEYDYPLPELGGQETVAYLGGNVLLRTGFYSTGDDSKYSYVPGYGVGNLDFGVRQANGRWDLSGWIHNFTNDRYYTFKVLAGSAPSYNLVQGEVGDPLTFGVTLRAKFN